jgi:hypothetical protein
MLSFSVVVIVLLVPQISIFPSSYSNFSSGGVQAIDRGTSSFSPFVSSVEYYNWAGYAVSSTANTVSKAQGSWIQPTISCNPSADALQWTVFWVGIDGLAGESPQTVEQAGTYGYCAQGSSVPAYAAWYEFWPAQDIISIPSITVHSGDTMKAIISYSSKIDKITVKIQDVTTGKSYSAKNPTGFTFSRSSAECITETPTSNGAYNILANFGTVDWGKDYTGLKNTCTATVNGATKPIGNFGSNSIDIIMCNYPSCSTVMALPSVISSDGTSFTVAFENSGP